jgi:oligopeptide transport system ATP-binding protein
MTELLQVEHLKKYFSVTRGVVLQRVVGHVHAVDDVSFTIRRGETLALVGESGCGKTTTGRLVLRLETPTDGRVLLDGTDVHQMVGQDMHRFHLRVQAVFQNPWSSLNPRMRVREIIGEALVVNTKMSRREIRERVTELLNEVGLQAAHGALYPHEFSGGQRQRIALAAALSCNPDLVVLDEPVSALDVSVQAQIVALLRKLREQHGVSYLLIAHNLAMVRYIADNVAVMYLGELVERAPSAELYSNAQHPYTQALLQSTLVPDPAANRTELVLAGEPPSPANPPAGCRFHTRCPYAMDVCRNVAPQTVETSPGHTVACHLVSGRENTTYPNDYASKGVAREISRP